MAKPISVQLYSLRERAKQDFVGVLKFLGELGYVGVETAGLHNMKALEVRKVIDDLGMVCSSMHVPVPNKDNIALTADQANDLGTDMIIAGLGPKEFATVEARKAAVAKLTEGCELAASAGLRFGYHNHWWEFEPVDGEAPYELLLREIPDLFSQLDTYWAADFGAVDVPRVVRTHAGRIASLHIKDGPLLRDQPHTAVGKGKMNIKPIVDEADPAVLEWMVVELDSCATDMSQAVADSYTYLVASGLAAGRK